MNKCDSENASGVGKSKNIFIKQLPQIEKNVITREGMRLYLIRNKVLTSIALRAKISSYYHYTVLGRMRDLLSPIKYEYNLNDGVFIPISRFYPENLIYHIEIAFITEEGIGIVALFFVTITTKVKKKYKCSKFSYQCVYIYICTYVRLYASIYSSIHAYKFYRCCIPQ